ncbi:hypothetical protein AMECASPLE_027556 [Ameca splendens]|uniref:Uncharacterized protein n=1 Tax=Ameca splendens TaxID=208324 RepID=A0ABV0ZQE5_9TELE
MVEVGGGGARYAIIRVFPRYSIRIHSPPHRGPLSNGAEGGGRGGSPPLCIEQRQLCDTLRCCMSCMRSSPSGGFVLLNNIGQRDAHKPGVRQREKRGRTD